MEVQISPETVLARAQRYFQHEWAHGGQIHHPTEHTIEVRTTRGYVPSTALGWVFNLTMTVLTFGAWLIVWLFWAMGTVDSPKDTVVLTAYPTDTGTLVEASSTNRQWRADVEAWIAEL